MGLLDNAIREHLELKRRRGADPAEIERDEQEALGPVRRAPKRTRNPQLEPAQHADNGDYEPEGDEPWDDPFADESEALADEPEPFDSEGEPSADEHSPLNDDDDDDDDPFRDEPRTRSADAPISDPNAATQIVNQEGDEPPPPPPRAASPPPSRDQLGEETATNNITHEDDEPEDAGDTDEPAAADHHEDEPAPASHDDEEPAAADHVDDEPETGEHGGENTDDDVLEETPNSFRTRPTTIGCGSSSARPATSTSTARRSPDPRPDSRCHPGQQSETHVRFSDQPQPLA